MNRLLVGIVDPLTLIVIFRSSVITSTENGLVFFEGRAKVVLHVNAY